MKTLLPVFALLFASARAAEPVDPFQPGTTWEGTRSYQDPVDGGNVRQSFALRVTRREGGDFAGRFKLNIGNAFIQGDVLGKVEGDSVMFAESNETKYRMEAVGRIVGDQIVYKFRGVGGQGKQRWGKGEMSLQEF